LSHTYYRFWTEGICANCIRNVRSVPFYIFLMRCAQKTRMDMNVMNTGINYAQVRFQVLTAASMKMTAFWDTAPCGVVSVYSNKTTRRFSPGAMSSNDVQGSTARIARIHFLLSMNAPTNGPVQHIQLSYMFINDLPWPLIWYRNGITSVCLPVLQYVVQASLSLRIKLSVQAAVS
jgi:hypothetical protein